MESFWDKMDKATDALEEAVFQLDIISSFASRGWSLYYCDRNDISELSQLKDIIERGREKEYLKYNEKYILLPLVLDDSNYDKVYEKTQLCLMYGRSPYFIDIREGYDDNQEKWVEPTAIFLVDSVMLVPPFLSLIIDTRLSKIRYPELYKFDNIEKYNIDLHLSELWKIRKQLMMSLRGNEIDYKNKIN